LPAPLGRALVMLANQAFVDGMRRAVIVGAIVALVGALVALIFLPAHATSAAAPARATTARQVPPARPWRPAAGALGLCGEAGFANLNGSAVVTRSTTYLVAFERRVVYEPRARGM
jgi:hypothetical protein